MAEAPHSKRPASKKSGVVVPHSPKWLQRVAAVLVYFGLRLLVGTLRFRLHLPSTHFTAAAAPEPVIFCIWHNRLATSMRLFHQFRRQAYPQAKLAALVSASKDGALLARILEWFQVQPVRGSSSRRGAQAVLELTTWAARGYDLALTPDGPRGPCYEVQEGAISLAQLTGRPLVPVTMNLSWKLRLKSWDRFQIPLPFARCEVVTGETIVVPAELDPAARAELRQRLQMQLQAITKD